jgi:hypothetical protein
VMYNCLVKVNEGELSGTKSNPLFYPNKSCSATMLRAKCMDANIITVAFMKVVLVFRVCVSFQMCLCAVVTRAFGSPWRTAGRTLCAGHVTGSCKIAVTCALSA